MFKVDKFEILSFNNGLEGLTHVTVKERKDVVWSKVPHKTGKKKKTVQGFASQTASVWQ